MATRRTSIRPSPFPEPKPREACALILAAGVGKRMHSRIPKVAHPLAGKAMVRYVVEAALAAVPRVLVVVGHPGEEVRAGVGTGDRRVEFCTQDRPLGTGHAVLCAEKPLRGVGGTLLILNGDLPSLRPQTLAAFLEFHHQHRVPLTLLTAMLEEPANYGRVIRNYNSAVSRVVEASDATPEEAAIREINAGIYCADLKHLFPALRQAGANNAQGEIYLTELVEILKRDHHKVAAYCHPDAEEVLGVNTRQELARATQTLFRRKAEALMAAGVSILDPDSTYVETPVEVGRDTVLYPMTFLEGTTVLGEGCRIGPGTRITDSVLGDEVEVRGYTVIAGSKIGPRARLGPFAHLRPETELAEEVHVGNFVETKKSRLGRGTKANHLTYLGDSEIGAGVNVGAGTITCNYDGEKKHRTVLEDGVFIGSDSQLVAPVRVRKGAYVGAGSTITKEVPAFALAIARGRQVNLENWVKKRGKRKKRG